MADKDNDWRDIGGAEDLLDVMSADEAEHAWTLYQQAKEQYRLYKSLRDTFESAMQGTFGKHIPAESELKFGYNFGKLSIAIGPKRERKAKAQTKGNLGDWLEAQRNSGHRA